MKSVFSIALLAVAACVALSGCSKGDSDDSTAASKVPKASADPKQPASSMNANANAPAAPQ